MLRNLKQIEGQPLQASDGEIGKVKDFYFDIQRWQIRYLIVDTGEWLNARRVLIAPEILRRLPSDPVGISVDLTREQVRNSPDIDTGKPVSAGEESALRRHYGWPDYWSGISAAAAPIIAAAVNTLGPGGFVNVEAPVPPAGDPHLRSAHQTRDYHITASDGSIGHVEDFLVDESFWRIRYLVIDTTQWWPGGKVVVSPEWIRAVDWTSRTVTVDLTRDQIKHSPPYKGAASLNLEYAAGLHDHYGRPRYPDWNESGQDRSAPNS